MESLAKQTRNSVAFQSNHRSHCSQHMSLQVHIKAVKMTSVKTQLPFQYYSLPFCEPDSKKVDRENLGEKLRGDRIQHTPYKVCGLESRGETERRPIQHTPYRVCGLESWGEFLLTEAFHCHGSKLHTRPYTTVVVFFPSSASPS